MSGERCANLSQAAAPSRLRAGDGSASMRGMASWIEAYESLDETRKVNVQRWMHLNKFIAQTLRLDERAWFEDWLGGVMAAPFDYGFMADTMPNTAGLDLDGETFSRGTEPGAFAGPRVALRAKNNLGKLSADLQDALSGLLERGDPMNAGLTPQDVASLQKIFPNAKGLAKLKRADFRGVQIAREGDEVTMVAPSGDEILRLNVLEFAGVMSRTLV